MIHKNKNPITYAAFLYELSDATEHLQELLQNIEKPTYLEEDFAIDLGHVYAHLNRAWNIRNKVDSKPIDYDNEWDVISAFPKDLKVSG